MRVNANTIVRNPRTGVVTVINAGDEAPEWAESRIGDHLKADEPKAERKPASRKSRAKAAPDDAAPEGDDN